MIYALRCNEQRDDDVSENAAYCSCFSQVQTQFILSLQLGGVMHVYRRFVLWYYHQGETFADSVSFTSRFWSSHVLEAFASWASTWHVFCSLAGLLGSYLQSLQLSEHQTSHTRTCRGISTGSAAGQSTAQVLDCFVTILPTLPFPVDMWGFLCSLRPTDSTVILLTLSQQATASMGVVGQALYADRGSLPGSLYWKQQSVMALCEWECEMSV